MDAKNIRVSGFAFAAETLRLSVTRKFNFLKSSNIKYWIN